jgi:hypothetical protein
MLIVDVSGAPSACRDPWHQAGAARHRRRSSNWPVGDTPLARNLTAQATPIKLKLAPRPALADVKPSFNVDRMRADVEWLAAPEREGRAAGQSRHEL